MTRTNRVFVDRAEAGRELALLLRDQLPLLSTPVYVLAVPRGGVPAAYEIATSLDLPLDVMLMAPALIPMPVVLPPDLDVEGVADASRSSDGAGSSQQQRLISAELAQLAKHGRMLRGLRPPPDLDGHTVLLVADGFADAGPLCRMVEQLRLEGARRIVPVTPVASPAAFEAACVCADGIVCLSVENKLEDSPPLYRDARPVAIHEVRRLLDHAARQPVTQ